MNAGLLFRLVICVCVSHQCVSVGVIQQPSLSQDSAGSPLSVMHRLDEPHQRDVAAETRTDGAKTRNRNRKKLIRGFKLSRLCVPWKPLGGSTAPKLSTVFVMQMDSVMDDRQCVWVKRLTSPPAFYIPNIINLIWPHWLSRLLGVLGLRLHHRVSVSGHLIVRDF